MVGFVEVAAGAVVQRRTAGEHGRVCSVRSPAYRSRSCSSLRTRVDMAKGIEFGSLDGSELRIGLVTTLWNGELVGAMAKDCKEALKECKVKEENIVEVEVPGAFEIPLSARYIALTQKVDAVINIGVLIEGETDHYHYIAQAVSSGLMQLQIQFGIPMMFGVLTCKDEAQAAKRSTGDDSHAAEWAKSAIQMALFRKSQVKAPKEKTVGFV